MQNPNNEIIDTLNEFLKKFSSLNHSEMMIFFSQDATAFFPLGYQAQRLNNKNEISVGFKKVINHMKKIGLSKISLEPQDIYIQHFNEVAIATFHFKGENLSRRTIVLRKIENNWLIEHLHASNGQPKEVKL
jgi:ketosteroid isomerase-like protein